MRLKNTIFLILGLFVMGGCAKVSHLDQLLTLKGLADEQAQMSLDAQEQDKKFDLMLAEKKAGTLDQYLTKGKILRTFGEPIYVTRADRDNQEVEKWLYRYTAEFFGSEKIYLYFDSEENLIESEYIGRGNGEVR